MMARSVALIILISVGCAGAKNYSVPQVTKLAKAMGYEIKGPYSDYIYKGRLRSDPNSKVRLFDFPVTYLHICKKPKDEVMAVFGCSPATTIYITATNDQMKKFADYSNPIEDERNRYGAYAKPQEVFSSYYTNNLKIQHFNLGNTLSTGEVRSLLKAIQNN